MSCPAPHDTRAWDPVDCTSNDINECMKSHHAWFLPVLPSASSSSCSDGEFNSFSLPNQRNRLIFIEWFFSPGTPTLIMRLLLRVLSFLLPHPNQDTAHPHHRRTNPPQSPNLLPKHNHPQHRGDQEIRRSIRNRHFCRRRGNCQRAREQRPHEDIAENIQPETSLNINRKSQPIHPPSQGRVVKELYSVVVSYRSNQKLNETLPEKR